MSSSHEPLFDAKLIDEKLRNVKTLQDLTGKNGVFQERFRSTIERILKAEQEKHLGFEPYSKPNSEPPANSRNGYSKNRLKTSAGDLEIKVPRDRDGTFEPQLIPKH